MDAPSISQVVTALGGLLAAIGGVAASRRGDRATREQQAAARILEERRLELEQRRDDLTRMERILDAETKRAEREAEYGRRHYDRVMHLERLLARERQRVDDLRELATDAAKALQNEVVRQAIIDGVEGLTLPPPDLPGDEDV